MSKVSNTIIIKEKTAIENAVGEIASLFKKIESEYLVDTQTVWDSENACEFVKSVSSCLNDFIKQVNTKFVQGFEDFTKEVNELNRSQNSNSPEIITISLPLINSTSVSWNGKTKDYLTPDDFVGFTNQHFTSIVDLICDVFDAIVKFIDSMHSVGLDASFCNTITSSLTSLSKSAQEVIKDYVFDAAQSALAEDGVVASFKSH